jgi:hypothetical protein
MFSTGAFRTNYGTWTRELDALGLPNHIGNQRLNRAGRHGQFYSAAKPMIYEF